MVKMDEWRWKKGTAFIQNPEMLANRLKYAQLGRQSQRQSQFEAAAMGDPTLAGQRAYTFGRDEDELNRLRMASEGRRLQNQMAFQPQMDAIRGGIMGRMAGNLGVNLPQMGGSYSSGTDYKPSWMQNYQVPKFPRY